MLTWDYKLLCLHQTNLLSTDHNLEFLCFENGLFRHLHCDIESVMLHITAAKGLHLKSHQRCPAGIRTCLSADQSSSSTLTESSFLFDHCLIPEVLNSSPRAPRSAYFACLSLLTHLIQIISLLEVRSMHELCSDWHAPYTGSIAPYSLSRGNPLKFTLFRNIHSWICAAQRLHARTSVTSYTSVNIYNFNSRLAHFNALWMEYIRSLRTGIMAEYPVMSTSQGTYVQIEQTSEAIRVTYEICRAGGGARTGIENRCLIHRGTVMFE